MPKFKTTQEALKSKVRFLLDFTEGTGFSTFDNESALHTSEHRKLEAFSYRKNQGGAAQAGYGVTTKMTPFHTNIDNPYRVPAGAIAKPTRIMVIPDGYLLKPLSLATVNSTVDDSDGQQQRTNDLDGKIFFQAWKDICACYKPVFVINDEPYDLGNMQLLGNDESQARAAALGAWSGGPSLEWKLPTNLTSEATFALRFELFRNLKNHAWNPDGVNAAEAPGTTIRTALGYPAAGAAPGAGGVVMACLDVSCFLVTELNLAVPE